MTMTSDGIIKGLNALSAVNFTLNFTADLYIL
jgi:hypothetical protein